MGRMKAKFVMFVSVPQLIVYIYPVAMLVPADHVLMNLRNLPPVVRLVTCVRLARPIYVCLNELV